MSDDIGTEFRAERLPGVDSPAQRRPHSRGGPEVNFTDDDDKDSQVHGGGVRALRASGGPITSDRTCNTAREEAMTVFAGLPR